MGLAQKRIIQEFQTNAFTTWKESFDKVVGFSLPFDVKWETMQSEDYQKRDDYFAWYNKVYFEPLLSVFTSLCADNMGKEAVKESVKKVVIDGTNGTNPAASTFDNGVFTLNHIFNTNVDDIDARVKVWQKLIEAKL